MLPNERFALACRAYYDEMGLVVDKRNGQFAHSPLTRKECDTGYYLLWEHHQHQGLLQSKDLDKCCFFSSDTKKWLAECDYWPDNYFELWDIYNEYSGKNARETNKVLHTEKDENGKSLFAVKTFAATLEKNPNHQSEAGKKPHEEKDETGKSKHARRTGKMGATKSHEEKDENGKSKNAVKNGKKALSVLRERDPDHQSKAAKKLAEKIHAEKDEKGRSKHAVKAGRKSHEEKDENGKSELAMKMNRQVWESTVDGFRSNPGHVAKHNRANGWDPNARVRVEAG